MACNTYRLNYPCFCSNGGSSYGKILYVFGGPPQSSSPPPGNKSGTAADTQEEQLAAKEHSKRHLQQIEKIHNVSLQDKEETISNLREVLVEYEKRIFELESGTDDNVNIAFQIRTERNIHSSPTQKLLDQIDRLQKEKETLLRKISNFETKEANVEPMAIETNEDLSEQSNLVYQLESCTTDTEKELANIKRIKHSLDLEVKKLRKENAFLCEKLRSLNVDVTDIGVESKTSQHLDSKSRDREHHRIDGIVHIIGQVYKEFLELKKSYLALKNDVQSVSLPIVDYVRNMQLQVQNTLSDVIDKNKEIVEKYLREMKLRKKYHNELVELRGNIRVLCRIRPWIKEDGNDGDAFVVNVDDNDDTLIKINNRGRIQFFDVDKAFGMESTQDQIFEEVSSLVRSVIDGYNVCIFAYGQTGSGKTYTMEGPKSDPGINQRALQLLFNETVDDNWQYQITASVLEIYNEVIRDLLNPDNDFKLEVKMKPEGGFHVPGLIDVPVSDLTTVNQIFETGRKNRAMASTNMNEHSSRSHCLLCVTVTGYNPTTGSKSVGRLNLVDLAGSERVSKSMADGIHLKEAQNINKSLSCLGDVIHALRNKQSHVPYRNSKLTFLLQDSLGGDSKTLMIVQVSPVEKNVSESVCSLAFSQRARSVELGAASRNVDGNRNSLAKRPSSLFTSSPSLSISLSSPTSPMSNCSQLSPSPNLSPSSSISNCSSLASPSSSPSFTRRKLPLSASQTSLKSPSSSPLLTKRRQPLTSSQSSFKSLATSSPVKPEKFVFNSKTPSPQLSGQRKLLPSTTSNSPSSPTPTKSLSSPRSSTTTARKLPKTPETSSSPLSSRKQIERKSTPSLND